jgi:hypothetical protein
MKISLEDVKGYNTIFKMLDRRSPLVRKLKILEESYNENDEPSSI